MARTSSSTLSAGSSKENTAESLEKETKSVKTEKRKKKFLILTQYRLRMFLLAIKK